MDSSQPISAFSQIHERIRNEDFQKNCMIAITVTSILSSIPYIRFASSLASRACSLILAGDVLVCGYQKDNKLGVALKCLKIAGILLSISAISLASYQMLMPALLIDIVFQSFQIVDLVKSRREAQTMPKLIGHISGLIVSNLLLSGLYTRSNILFGMASIVNIVTMSFFACYSDRRLENIEQFNFILLAIQSLVTITSFTRINSYTSTFSIKNNTDAEMKITTLYNEPIREIKPGETAVFEAPFSLNGLHSKQYNLDGKLISETTYWPSTTFKSGENVTPIEINKVPMLCIAGATIHSADEMEFEGPLTKRGARE